MGKGVKRRAHAVVCQGPNEVGSAALSSPYVLLRSFPAHAGIQTGSPRSRGRAEIYRLPCNSDAAVQPRKDSQQHRKP